MSRYIIPAISPKHVVAIGWDNPLETFFATVTTEDEEDAVVRIGLSPKDKVTDVRVLAARLAQYATIGPDVIAGLEEDYAYRTTPTPLQRGMRALFEEQP